jgi:hypothetical protein
MSNKNLFADPGTTSTLLSYLTADITNSQTDIPINDASNFPTKGTIQIGTEIIKYTSKNSSTNTLTNCLRSTNVSSHSQNDIVTLTSRTSESPLGNDTFYAGWYKERGSSTQTLRVTDSNLMMKGTVRFNQATETFQGYNGTEWVTFNAEKGDQGDPGQNASELFNFINLPEGMSALPDTVGGVFSSKNVTDVNLRSLRTGTFDLNAGVTSLNAMSIVESTDYLTLTPSPRPYVWDFSTSAISSINYLKSNLSDAKLKAFGTVSKWRVKTGSIIQAGTAVRFTLNTSDSYPTYSPATTYIVIEPYTYNTLVQENTAGCGFLGIALETVIGNGTTTCEVCTEGITTVKIGDLTNPFSYGITLTNIINGPGAYGFVGNNSEIYNVAQSSGFISNLPIAGYWMERGTFPYGEGVLFYVKGSLTF